MNTKSLFDFITKLEEMCKACNSEDVVRDFSGTCSKSAVLSQLISDARELIQYGEYQIALENLLDNLTEYELKLDAQTLDFAVRAFENNIPMYSKNALAALKKDDVGGAV